MQKCRHHLRPSPLCSFPHPLNNGDDGGGDGGASGAGGAGAWNQEAQELWQLFLAAVEQKLEPEELEVLQRPDPEQIIQLKL